jgi:hypothetical protein
MLSSAQHVVSPLPRHGHQTSGDAFVQTGMSLAGETLRVARCVYGGVSTGERFDTGRAR